MKYMTTSIREYSQWFRGEDNVVADPLSRDNNHLDEELTQLFCTHCPLQILPYFKIQCLPSKITLWLTELLLKLPMKAQFNKKHTSTSLGHETDGQSTADGLDSWTHSLTTPPAPQVSILSAPFLWLCTRQEFQDHLMTNWLTTQSQVPSHMYVRPSVNMEDPTHPWTIMESLDFFYNGSSDHSSRPTPPKKPESNPDVSHLHHGKTTTFRTWPRNCPTNRAWDVLSLLILRVSQSPPSQTRPNWNPQDAQHKILQRWSNPPIFPSGPQIRGLHLTHIWPPEETRDKTSKITSHKNQLVTQSFAPSALLQALSDPSSPTKEHHRHQQPLRLHVQWLRQTRHILASDHCPLQCRMRHWQSTPGNFQGKNWHPLHQIGRRNGHVRKCLVYTIMLISQWSSKAFLWYIRKQVMEFTHNVSKRMLTFQNYRHVPNFDHGVSANNPRVRNNPNNTKT